MTQNKNNWRYSRSIASTTLRMQPSIFFIKTVSGTQMKFEHILAKSTTAPIHWTLSYRWWIHKVFHIEAKKPPLKCTKAKTMSEKSRWDLPSWWLKRRWIHSRLKRIPNMIVLKKRRKKWNWARAEASLTPPSFSWMNNNSNSLINLRWRSKIIGKTRSASIHSISSSLATVLALAMKKNRSLTLRHRSTIWRWIRSR